MCHLWLNQDPRQEMDLSVRYEQCLCHPLWQQVACQAVVIGAQYMHGVTSLGWAQRQSQNSAMTIEGYRISVPAMNIGSILYNCFMLVCIFCLLCRAISGISTSGRMLMKQFIGMQPKLMTKLRHARLLSVSATQNRAPAFPQQDTGGIILASVLITVANLSIKNPPRQEVRLMLPWTELRGGCDSVQVYSIHTVSDKLRDFIMQYIQGLLLHHNTNAKHCCRLDMQMISLGSKWYSQAFFLRLLLLVVYMLADLLQCPHRLVLVVYPSPLRAWSWKNLLLCKDCLLRWQWHETSLSCDSNFATLASSLHLPLKSANCSCIR